ncbi:hypothetical protein [Streptomyces sp. YIM 98790]|uniref:hypothetical protein n=1 Tax=Streptomyces sp. YIM 98790 TaxID=2689077 RepID=UPI001408A0E4|nr:hypothetical protein [Streptomyces sp. YIM 98790]
MSELLVLGILFLITCMLVRGQDVTIWQAVIIALMGYYMAITPVGWALFAVLKQIPFLSFST